MNNGIKIKTLSIRKWPSLGIEVRNEEWTAISTGISKPLKTRSMYSLDNGIYLGSADHNGFFRMFKRFGITKFEKTKPDHTIATIGFSNKNDKWYGWSHRAIAGFDVGHKIKQGDIGYNEFYKKYNKNKIETKEEAKDMAVIFSLDVSHTIKDHKNLIFEIYKKNSKKLLIENDLTGVNNFDISYEKAMNSGLNNAKYPRGLDGDNDQFNDSEIEEEDKEKLEYSNNRHKYIKELIQNNLKKFGVI